MDQERSILGLSANPLVPLSAAEAMDPFGDTFLIWLLKQSVKKSVPSESTEIPRGL